MPLTLGIDPTSRDTLGWATIESGGLLAFGDVKMSKALDQSEIGLLSYQSDQLAALIEQHRPAVVAIERPITNSRAAARYLALAAEQGDGAPLIGRLTGAVSSSIDVGLAVGCLVHVCICHKTPVLIVNPGSAKHMACGSVAANKQTVREAARLRVYEMTYQEAMRAGRRLPMLDKIKRPSEHIAAAIFVGLVGDHQQRIAQATRAAA